MLIDQLAILNDILNDIPHMHKRKKSYVENKTRLDVRIDHRCVA